MLTHEKVLEIRELASQGVGVRDIERKTGVSRNTVRRYLRNERACRYGPRPARPTKLQPYHAFLLERIEAAHPKRIPATRLLMEIRDRGYEGGVSQLRAFLLQHKRARRS